MTAKLLDGKALAELQRLQLQQQIAILAATMKRSPALAVILLGADKASQIYVQNKRKACAQVGIISIAYDLPSTTSQQQLLTLLAELNQRLDVDGILVQLPLPGHIDADQVLDAIEPAKDVDGFHPYNLGLLAQKRPGMRPCTPYGVIKLLTHYKIALVGLNAVVVGASNIVGRPMAFELLNAGCTVTICHSLTKKFS